MYNNEQLNRFKEHEAWKADVDTEKVVPELLETIEDLQYELRKAIGYTKGVPKEILDRWIIKSKKLTNC